MKLLIISHDIASLISNISNNYKLMTTIVLQIRDRNVCIPSYLYVRKRAFHWGDTSQHLQYLLYIRANACTCKDKSKATLCDAYSKSMCISIPAILDIRVNLKVESSYNIIILPAVHLQQSCLLHIHVKSVVCRDRKGRAGVKLKQ